MFEDYDRIEKEKNALERCIYEHRLAENQAQITKLQRERNVIMTQREQNLEKRELYLL